MNTLLQDFTTPATALRPGIFYEFSDLLVHVKLCRRDPCSDEIMTVDNIVKIARPTTTEPRPEISENVANALMDVVYLLKERLDSYFFAQLFQIAYKVSLINCLWAKMSGICMVPQVMCLYYLNTRHPYCPVFRWLLY